VRRGVEGQVTSFDRDAVEMRDAPPFGTHPAPAGFTWTAAFLRLPSRMVFIYRARGIKSIFRPGTYRRESDSRASRHVPNQLRSRLNAFARALAHVRADLDSRLETRVSSMHDGSIPIDRGRSRAVRRGINSARPEIVCRERGRVFKTAIRQ